MWHQLSAKLISQVSNSLEINLFPCSTLVWVFFSLLPLIQLYNPLCTAKKTISGSDDSGHLSIYLLLFLSKSFFPFLYSYCRSDVICAEHQAKLGGGFCSLLYYACNGPVVSKAMKINSKLLQISREKLVEPAEKHKSRDTQSRFSDQR